MCVLCSGNARFVLQKDKRHVFRLASVPSEVGQALSRKHGIDPDDPTSMLVVEGDRVRRDSDAVLSIYERLGFQLRDSVKGPPGSRGVCPHMHFA